MTLLHWEIEPTTKERKHMGIDGTMEKINAILADPKDGFQNDIDHLLTRVLADGVKLIRAISRAQAVSIGGRKETPSFSVRRSPSL